MKTKIIFHLTLVVVLATFATGCCTRGLVEFSNKETVDRFFPDSVYKSTNGSAFGGNLHKQRFMTPNMGEMDKAPPVYCYLIFSQTNVSIASFHTNSSTLLKEIDISPANALKTAKVESKLPPDFEKIADLSKNDASLVIKKHHPNEGFIVLAPIAVAADVAMSPVYVVVYIAMANGETAVMAEEIFDIVNERDEVVGQNTRREVHARGLWHRAVHVLVFNARGEVFLQKRSMRKDIAAGKWDSSASGHLDSGEDYDACHLELKSKSMLMRPTVIHKTEARPLLAV